MYLILSNIHVKNINININDKYQNKNEYIISYNLPYVSLNGLFFKINLNNHILRSINNNMFIYYIYINNSNDRKLLLEIENYLKLHINNFILLKKYKNNNYIICRSKNKINRDLILCLKKIKLINGKYIPNIYLNG